MTALHGRFTRAQTLIEHGEMTNKTLTFSLNAYTNMYFHGDETIIEIQETKLNKMERNLMFVV